MTWKCLTIPKLQRDTLKFGNGWVISSHTLQCMRLHKQWHASKRDPGGRFKNTYELLNLRALKFSQVNKINMLQCMGKIFVWNFKWYLWNSTQNILPTHWKIEFLYNIEILRTLRFKSSHAVLKRPLVSTNFSFNGVQKYKKSIRDS